MKSHMNVIFEKPYFCEVCQKSYTDKSNLMQHNKSAGHMKRVKSNESNPKSQKTSFVDFKNLFLTHLEF